MKKDNEHLKENSKLSSIRIFADRSLKFGMFLAFIGTAAILTFSYLKNNFVNVQSMFIGLSILCGIFVSPVFAKAWQKGKEKKDDNIPNTDEMLKKVRSIFKTEENKDG